LNNTGSFTGWYTKTWNTQTLHSNF